MNRQIKRVSLLVLIMFFALFASTTNIQVLQADQLNNDQRNTRTLYDSFLFERGSILVDGVAIAESTPVDSNFSYMREYPKGDLYSAVTGYYTINQGITGLESVLNNYLSGTDSSRFLDKISEIITGQPVRGASVELTLDAEVQQAAYDALGDNKGAAVAIVPSTGEILALVSKPSLDPNLLTSHTSSEVLAAYRELEADPGRPMTNRAIAGDLYWPGSVFKLVVMAAALESGKYTPQSTFPNLESIQLPLSSHQVRNANRSTCGSGETVTLENALRLSCNVPFVQLGLELGANVIQETAEAFGFNRAISIPLQTTTSVFPTELDGAQLGMVSFGQYEVKTTPLQMAMVVAAIANKGVEMAPYLVEQIFTPSLKVLEQAEPKVFSKPMTKAHAETLTELMVKAVHNGIASGAKIDGINVAGKTGTAETGQKDYYQLWFTGFAPAENPQVAVAVIVEQDMVANPTANSNNVAAPIAKQVMEAVLNR